MLEFALELGVRVMVKVRLWPELEDAYDTKRLGTKMLRNVWKPCEKVKELRLTVPRRSLSPRRTCRW